MEQFEAYFPTVSGGEASVPTDLVAFSAKRCFAVAHEIGTHVPLYKQIAATLSQRPGPVALVGLGTFLDDLLTHAPELATKAIAILAPGATVTEHRGLPVVQTPQELPAEVRTVFLCELAFEPRQRLRYRLSEKLQVLCPDLLAQFGHLVPQQGWVTHRSPLYPVVLPEIEFKKDLDVLLLQLPARNNFGFPLSLGYVHKLLQRTPGITFQTFDVDSIFYHRYHMWRIFDHGEPVKLDIGRPLEVDPWQWNDEVWMDPRMWASLHAFFAPHIAEVVTKIIAARPKVVAFSVHQRNEWVTRYVAQKVKEALPETMIVGGGHSCQHPVYAARAFPEHDYIVVGEAEGTFGELAQRLAAGERPRDLPGVVSKYDTPGRECERAANYDKLDEVGAPAYDWFEGYSFPEHLALFRAWDGKSQPYVSLTRGCIWSLCTFCSERFKFRTRSAKNFVDELQEYTRHGLQVFNFSDSDFGGRTEVLRAVAEEIVARGLKVNLIGQLRMNGRHDFDLLKKAVNAGIICNFGIDALTPRTLKLQKKGYSIHTVKRNLELARDAGVAVVVNLLTGVPGEWEEDVDMTIQFIIDHRDCITQVFNISPFNLVHGSVYWDNPEQYRIRFIEDREFLFRKYYHSIPDRYWYSVDPFIDSSVRKKRAFKILSALRAANVPVSEFAEATVLKPMFEGYWSPRDLLADAPSLDNFSANRTRPVAPVEPLTNQLAGRIVVDIGTTRLAIKQDDIPTLRQASGLVQLRNRAGRR
jgi:radical SAM superfamily enzyme YgiQ (UPF0313 family)